MSQPDNRGQILLENAYALSTPEDNREYYADFAEHYDDTFAQNLGYRLPDLTAKRFLELRTPNDTPIADIGCGTGLVAQALQISVPIDGYDISAEMLDAARRKGHYRYLYEVDLTQDLNPDLPRYGAVLSSGTFTHGHLGPEALMRLLSLGRPEALFVLSINTAHYVKLGFERVLESLLSTKQIRDLSTPEIRIYTREDHDHGEDTAFLCSFRKV